MSLFGDLNEVRILGNMTSDPELRYTSSGTPVLNLSVATNRSYKAGEEWKDETEFHNIVLFGNLAEGVARRAHKGTRVMISGRLRTSSWEDQSGKKNYKTEIVADDLFLIDRYEKGKNEDLAAPTVSGGGTDSGFGNNSGVQGNSGDKHLGANSGNSSESGKAKLNQDDIIDPDDLPF